MNLNGFAGGNIQDELFCLVPERLPFLWSIDPVEADSFGSPIMENFHGIAVQNLDQLSRKGKNRGNTKKNKKKNE
jgi:hypothetical protein